MLTITLLDVSGLVGLKRTSRLLDIDFKPDNVITPNISSTRYMKFIKNTMGKDAIVSDEEHIAFLHFWLYHSFICNNSFAIGQEYLPQENLLHEGKDAGLGKILHASLYESLSVTYKELSASGSIPSNMTGPLWLLQM